MIPVDWPAGVPMKLQRTAYSRDPQDLVRRMTVDAGPPLRFLIDGAAGQRVRGVLSLTPAEAGVFELWRRETLDRGMGRFNWSITDNGRPVIARFAAQPKLSLTPSRWRYQLDIDCAPPDPAPAGLAALAALEDAAPAAWPAAVPFRPQRTGFASEPFDQVIRSPDNALQRQALSSRAEGASTDIELNLTAQQLADLETWFETDAGFGVCDVVFPDLAGGTHLGSFDGTYKIRPARSALWAVSFRIYLEAIA